MCSKLRCVVIRSRTRIVFLEAEGRLCERVDHKNDQDDREEDAVDVDVGKRWWRRLVAGRALPFEIYEVPLGRTVYTRAPSNTSLLLMSSFLKIASAHLLPKCTAQVRSGR